MKINLNQLKDSPIVTLPQGQIQGKRWSSGSLYNTFLAFKGIPYTGKYFIILMPLP